MHNRPCGDGKYSLCVLDLAEISRRFSLVRVSRRLYWIDGSWRRILGFLFLAAAGGSSNEQAYKSQENKGLLH